MIAEFANFGVLHCSHRQLPVFAKTDTGGHLCQGTRHDEL